ncbi:ABC transporter permease [Tardiphaga sp.]|uniref:ABC transporter permease n=1 Tax=Tardiphaga sp. TaxID=1926292 RepID=UPI0037D9B776
MQLIAAKMISPGLLIIVWEAASRFGLMRPAFLPALSDIALRAVVLFQNGELVAPLMQSLWRTAAGLSLALAFGVVLGLCMARVSRLDWFFGPLVTLGLPIPKITLLPIFILWFGIADLSKIALVAFTCVFPIVVATREGARTVPLNLLWAAQAMGAHPNKILFKVILPATLPSLLSGIRVAIPLALLTTFTAEMVGGGGGLGGLLTVARRLFETSTVFVYIIAMGIVGYVLDESYLRLRARLLAWAE